MKEDSNDKGKPTEMEKLNIQFFKNLKREEKEIQEISRANKRRILRGYATPNVD